MSREILRIKILVWKKEIVNLRDKIKNLML